MKPRIALVAVAGVILVAGLVVVSRIFTAPTAALPLAKPSRAALITSASSTPTSLDEGTLRLSAIGENVERYAVSATCPPQVFLKRGDANLCGSRYNFTEDELERLTLAVRNPTHATGTITIAVQIETPDVPAAPWTRKIVNVALTGR
jgi:hypothetical protein